MNRLRLPTALALAILLCLPAAHAAKLYKWVDADGKVHYTDRPPAGGAGRVEERALDSEPEAAGDAALEAAAAKNPITLYSIPKCSTCDLARLYLTKRRLPFTEKNVSPGNDANQKDMLEKVGELVVPTITVGTRAMKGAYVESLLESELEHAGYPKPESAAAGQPPAAEGAEAAAPPPPAQP